METATSLVISQLAEYLRGLTQRLDLGTGWYGEFLRRDPEGVRACLEGAAIPPWDVVESLLRDLAAARGEELAAREGAYAARLRAAAVAAWDAQPGGAERLRAEYAEAVAQQAAAREAVRILTFRLGRASGPAQADALARELAWAHDDAARATARHADLAIRLSAQGPAADAPRSPFPGVPGVPGQRTTSPEPPSQAAPRPHTEAPAPAPTQLQAWPGPEVRLPPPAQASPRPHAEAPASDRADAPGRSAAEAPASGAAGPGGVEGRGPVGRAEGRWLRGRRGGGARYAGMAGDGARGFVPPPGQPAAPDGAGSGVPAPRGARFGWGTAEPEAPAPATVPPAGDPECGGARFGWGTAEPEAPAPATVPPTGDPESGGARFGWGTGEPGAAAPATAPPAGDPESARAAAGDARAVVGELTALRAQGRGGEAHALLCEIAAWPADRLPGLAGHLVRAGLAADWATLLWEAASLPPDRLAAAAAALGASGREADCDRLLRQGASRPTAEIADAALALGASGRTREADSLLGAFVRVRTAEEAAALARRDPRWFTPRLLQAAAETSAAHHRDLVHALRLAGLATA
ncbi:hypothetical protein [Streptomyces subrutilus]|uniref:hypothetical protein n=1 Tax=Streptomyces subrutilus TaxID=36818 RepID=UPI0033E1E98A